MPLAPDLLPTKDVQLFLKDLGYLPSNALIDGIPGPAFNKATLALVRDTKRFPLLSPNGHTWSDDRRRTAAEQLVIHKTTAYDLGTIDGLIGPRTTYALELYQNKLRDATLTEPLVSHQPTIFPRQRDMIAFFGNPGTPQCRALTPSLYPLRMDGSLSKTALIPFGKQGAPAPINRIALHEKLHSSFAAIQRDILAHYGLAQIQALGLDQYAGSYNYRPMRGGSALSMHAWGAAIDFDAQRNTLRETSATARFARSEYKPFVDVFYDHGWISLGRERNFDWMHFQAPRL